MACKKLRKLVWLAGLLIALSTSVDVRGQDADLVAGKRLFRSTEISATGLTCWHCHANFNEKKTPDDYVRPGHPMYNVGFRSQFRKWDGKPLNAPNDVVVHPEDGAVWFTDPGYGSLMNYEGNKGTLHIKEAVYRIDAKTGAMDKVADDIYKPNGLCFSPDYRKLYVADTGATHYPDAPRVIKVWDVLGGKRLVNGREFASMVVNGKGGLADGIRADIDGNVWASAGWVGDGYDGVHIFAPDGVRIGQIKLPEICSNVCFGGKKRNRLFMTGSQSLYAVYVETQGAHIS